MQTNLYCKRHLLLLSSRFRSRVPDFSFEGRNVWVRYTPNLAFIKVSVCVESENLDSH